MNAPIMNAAGVITDVREGGISVALGDGVLDIALRLDREGAGFGPPFVKGERLSLSYVPLPPLGLRSLDLLLRRGKGETARTIEFLRMKAFSPVMRFLADGQVQLEQVGVPHPAREADGRTPHGLDVRVTVAGQRAVFAPGEVVPATLREGAAEVRIASSLLRGGTATPEGGVPPYHLLVVLVPVERPAEEGTGPQHPVGPRGVPVPGLGR